MEEFATRRLLHVYVRPISLEVIVVFQQTRVQAHHALTMEIVKT